MYGLRERLGNKHCGVIDKDLYHMINTIFI